MSVGEARALQWYERHAAPLANARRACLERSCFSLFADTPDAHPGGAGAQLAGAAAMAEWADASPWERRFGASTLALHKRYRLVPGASRSASAARPSRPGMPIRRSS